MASIVSTLVQVHVARLAADGWQHLLLRRRDDDQQYPGLWQCITGTVCDGETMLAAAHRELSEEVRLTVLQWWALPVIGMFYDRARDALEIPVAFGAVVSSDAEPTLSEHAEHRWLALDAAFATLVVPAHREGTRMFEHVLTDSRREDYERLYRLS